MKLRIYVVGIHTDVGKTHFSAAFCKAFDYDYFKLIQAGSPSDSEFIARFSPTTHVFQSGVSLQTPASPHICKKLENLDFKAFDIALPQSEQLVIETAGGLFTPIDEKYTMIDYITAFKYPCILVAKYYLGAINHTLLSIESLKSRQIPLISLVMMGEKDEYFDEFIHSYTDVTISHLNFYDENDFVFKTETFRNTFEHTLNNFEMKLNE